MRSDRHPALERRVGSPAGNELAARPDVGVAKRAAGQWGVLSLDELRACGLSRKAVHGRVRAGWLHRLHRGVYAVGHASVSREGEFLAAVKACGPRAFLSHLSAAELWGFVDWAADRYPEVTVIGQTRRVHQGIRVHRTTALDRRDRCLHREIPVTSPARTLLDLAAALDHRPLRRAVRQAQSLRRVNASQLTEQVSRAAPRRGVRRMRRMLATGPAPTRSELEDVVLELILSGGLAHPEVNAPILLGDRRVIPDFRWPEQRLVLEADGAAWHDGRLAREDDAERQALLESHGERVLRITWRQAIGHPRQTLARIREAGAPIAPSGERVPGAGTNSPLGR